MNKEHLQGLLQKYLTGTASVQETEELMGTIADDHHKSMIRELIGEQWSGWNVPKLLSSDQSEQMYQAVTEAIQPFERPVLGISRARIFRWAAVAASIIILGGVYYLYRPENKNIVADIAPVVVADVAAPASVHAVITLSDGSRIVLDSVSIGTLAVEEQVVLEKKADGEITYSGQTQRAAMNTLYNPRGSKVVSVGLADGTRVWLNSESSLTYPTAFTGNERKVQMTGEVYFEIAKDKTRPFRVQVNEAEVEVLGTHFNINAYADEPHIRTTLLEGRIKFKHHQQSKVIEPGQQVRLNAMSGEVTMEKKADVNQVMAWRNGFFEFDDVDLTIVMRQISRWYDVQIVYENIDTSIRLGGGISRNLNLQYLLRLLKMNGVNTKLEGRKLYVST